MKMNEIVEEGIVDLAKSGWETAKMMYRRPDKAKAILDIKGMISYYAQTFEDGHMTQFLKSLDEEMLERLYEFSEAHGAYEIGRLKYAYLGIHRILGEIMGKPLTDEDRATLRFKRD